MKPASSSIRVSSSKNWYLSGKLIIGTVSPSSAGKSASVGVEAVDDTRLERGLCFGDF
jgi:hypothetical protein